MRKGSGLEPGPAAEDHSDATRKEPATVSFYPLLLCSHVCVCMRTHTMLGLYQACIGIDWLVSLITPKPILEGYFSNKMDARGESPERSFNGPAVN